MVEAKNGTTIMRGMTQTGYMLALLLTAAIAFARDAPSSTPQATSALTAAAKPNLVPRQISYVNGQLTINVLDTTLADVLTKVAALTGVKLEVPPGASAERLTVVELGPGPARQILASLLSDSSFDFVIQSSPAEPDKVQSVLLMVREKKTGSGNVVEAAVRGARSPYARSAAPPAEPVEPPVPEAPVPAQPSNPAPDPGSSDQTQPDGSTRPQLTQPAQSSFSRPGALSPPTNLTPQSMSQQLQQMYQQRQQMIQQDKMTGQQTTPANPGNN